MLSPSLPLLVASCCACVSSCNHVDVTGQPDSSVKLFPQRYRPALEASHLWLTTPSQFLIQSLIKKNSLGSLGRLMIPNSSFDWTDQIATKTSRYHETWEWLRSSRILIILNIGYSGSSYPREHDHWTAILMDAIYVPIMRLYLWQVFDIRRPWVPSSSWSRYLSRLDYVAVLIGRLFGCR